MMLLSSHESDIEYMKEKKKVLTKRRQPVALIQLSKQKHKPKKTIKYE